MDWKRKLELLGGLATAGLGVIVVMGAVNESRQIRQMRGEPAAIGKAFVVAMMLYGLPSLFVALGAFTHAVRGGDTTDSGKCVSTCMVFSIVCPAGVDSLVLAGNPFNRSCVSHLPHFSGGPQRNIRVLGNRSSNFVDHGQSLVS
jgi:hypothetical protein